MKHLILSMLSILRIIILAVVVLTGGLYYMEYKSEPEDYLHYAAVVSTKESFTDEHIFFYSFRRIEGKGIEWLDVLWCDANDGRGMTKVDDINIKLAEYSYPPAEAYIRAVGVVGSTLLSHTSMRDALRKVGHSKNAHLWRWKGILPLTETISKCYVETFYETQTPIFGLFRSGVTMSNVFDVSISGDTFKALESYNAKEREVLHRGGVTKQSLEQINRSTFNQVPEETEEDPSTKE